MKKPSDSGKTENKGIQRTPSKTARETGLILLFDGEAGPVTGPRRAQPNRYPDSEPRTALPPSRSDDQWPWEFVARYSGATVPGFHGVP